MEHNKYIHFKTISVNLKQIENNNSKITQINWK